MSVCVCVRERMFAHACVYVCVCVCVCVSVSAALLTLLVDPAPLLEPNTLPFSHMLLMLRMPSVTTGRSLALDLGERASLLDWSRGEERREQERREEERRGEKCI